MRRIGKSEFTELPSLRLDPDDISKLWSILNEVGREVSMRTEEFELDGPDELQALSQTEVTTLDLRCREPYITIDLDPFRAQIYAADDDAVSLGTVKKLKDVLLTRRRWYAFLFSPWLAPAPAGAALIATVISLGARNWPAFGVSVAVLVLGAIWIRISFVQTTRRYVVISTKVRADRPTFWQRNRDALVVALVAATVSAALTFTFTWLATRGSHQQSPPRTTTTTG